MRQLLLALLLAAALPAAAHGAEVTFALPDETEQTVVLDSLEPDVYDEYEWRAEDGRTDVIRISAGWSLRRLLKRAGVPLDGFDYVEVPEGDERALVMRDQAVDRDRPPVVWQDADALQFLPPLTGEDDVNNDDWVISHDGTLRVELGRGFPIGVRVDASARRVRRGGSIAFRGVVGVGARPGMRVRWYFEEGSGFVYGSERTQVFRRPGPHKVFVAVMLGAAVAWETTIHVDVDAPRRSRRLRQRRPDPDPPPAERSQGTGEGTGAGPGGIGAGARTSTGTATLPLASSPPPPARTAPRRRAPRTAPRRTVVSGILLASADTAPLAGGLSRESRPRPAADEAPLEIPTGVWVALGLVGLLALGWAIEARTTQPFWQSDLGAPE